MTERPSKTRRVLPGKGDTKLNVLLVEDHPQLRASLQRAIDAVHVAIPCATVGDAHVQIQGPRPIAGAILDIQLPDGSGLDILMVLRAWYPSIPVLVMTGHENPNVPRQSHLLDATYVPKPVPLANISHFLRMVESAARTDDKLGRVMSQFAAKYELPVAAVRLLRLALSGVERRHLATTLKVSENTVKSQIRSMLGRTGATSLDGVERMILAMLGTDGREP